MPLPPASVSSDAPPIDDSRAMSSIEHLVGVGSSLKLPCGAIVRNRLVKVAMAECLSRWGGGPPNEKHARLYRAWAEGDWAMIITGNVQIDPLFLSTPRDLAVPAHLSSPDAPLPLEISQPWTTFIQAYNNTTSFSPSSGKAISSPSSSPPLIAQISHPGRQSPFLCHPVFSPPCPAPSPFRVGSDETHSWVTSVFNRIMFDQPKEMSDGEIERIAVRFGEAAAFLERVGFAGVEVHGAHGYLLSQFLSPLSNRRPSSSPFSLSPPAPYLPLGLEILRLILLAVRQRTFPSFIVGIKLSCGDFVDGGLSEEDALKQARGVRDMIVSVEGKIVVSDDGSERKEDERQERWDFIEISGGGYGNPVFASMEGPNESFQNFTQKLLSSTSTENSLNPNPPPILLSSSLRSIDSISSALSPQPSPSNPSPTPSAHLLGFARPSIPFPRLPLTHLLASPPIPIPQLSIPNFSLWKAIISAGGRIRLAGAGVGTIYWTFGMARIARGERAEETIGMGFGQGLWEEVVAGLREASIGKEMLWKAGVVLVFLCGLGLV